eukprot:GCRY01003663.1.p1 GENE.GCRY01003663.1~~GCRY01003663.1.p1  ORF type:complete len:261 (-),score=43.05 GCRY01003663.1:2-784(-)
MSGRNQKEHKRSLPQANENLVEENEREVKNLPSTDEEAVVFERDYVSKVYDIIAPHFSSTRYKPWPVIEQFLTNIPKFACVADVGCGNGKYLGVNRDLNMFGSDCCPGLVNICRANQHEALVADNLSLPYRDQAFDHVISIAVIHHFSTAKRRAAALKELARIVRPSGTGLVFAWAKENRKRQQAISEQFVPWHLQKKFRSEKTHHGVQSAKDKDAVMYKRYYHMFEKGELEDLASTVAGIEVIESGYDKENWYIKFKTI